MKPSIFILPNENILNVSPYALELEEKISCHGKGIHHFSNLYNLGITPESLGMPNGVYSGNRYQIALVSLGHVCICFDEEIWIFCPEFMSKKQKEWFIKKKLFFLDIKRECIMLLLPMIKALFLLVDIVVEEILIKNFINTF